MGGEQRGRAVVPLASMRGIWKFFGGVAVLGGVDLDLDAGEVHALLGGNGSGKSTLMKILSGAYHKDGGVLELDGSEVELTDPDAAHKRGVYLVPQEPKIFPNMSVLENVLCGMKARKADMAGRVASIAESLGFEGSLHDPASILSIANQQLLEIIRGLVRDARVLILDEPTSTLTFKEVASLFDRMRTLTADGIGIFFISHRLNEVLEISDRVSVLRDGAIVMSERTSGLKASDIVRAMLPAPGSAGSVADAYGPDRATRLPAGDSPAAGPKPRRGGYAGGPSGEAGGAAGPDAFRVEALSGFGFTDVSFSVRAGEVLGFAGVVGAGRTELAHAILGLDPFASGRVFVGGKELAERTPRKCLDMGLGYLPEDRHLHGIFLDLPCGHTLSAGVLDRLGRVFVSRRREAELADRYAAELKIKMSSTAQRARTLSGGNQQKVVLAKLLAAEPRVVILDEPTRGVDAKARQDVYRLIRDLSAGGISVVLISSDLPEVIQESDRIVVMHNGRIEAEFDRPSFDLERITASAFGLGASA